ncbi:MAG: cupin domain-containing protein [Bacteroidetes bacterium]|nr:cupin domain-containing protein [Bacteroidota bacterium]
MNKISLEEKFSLFTDKWHPRIVAALNGQHVKLAKIEGEFVWHQHENEDELFLVIKGEFEMHYRDRIELIKEGELIVVPKGVEHKPVAKNECHILLFEPDTTVNTGNNTGTLTKEQLDWL